MKTPPAPVTALLEAAIRRYLALDPNSRARLEALGTGVVALHITGIDLTLHFIPGDGFLQVSGRYDGEPDAHIAASPLTLARLLSDDPGAPLPETVTLVGDVELARRLNDLLRGVDLHWEDLLARLVGEAGAQRVRRGLCGLRARWHRASDGVQGRVGEQLRGGPLAGRAEVEAYMDAVDRLRSDADRLEARIRRLEGNRPGGGV
ncbi:ubiquinone biosynthesis accessory factor UbiJ [Ectothiorhodospira mobilis]|uniref:ubiquinone biosynthesis accessory factor UbiJ n=1 Tax=Ectothiorhodospira mobilis TaxID=195064 RepID=UPI001EE97FA2|nr:SCP2 sterol-binding domain-containing protein [Ectothiorhodospira mobilis]MCG5536025.1 SCP2 sterol-binding domain-containing protein [Ectothiorhodospira mobilis]